MPESNGIAISNMCYQCQALNELCPDCQEQRDSNDIFIAHQIVDESYDSVVFGYGKKARHLANGGSSTEYRPMSIIRDLPSGHDWTDREGEFLEPIALLVDRIIDLETSITVSANETVCQSCHYLHNKATACPNCN